MEMETYAEVRRPGSTLQDFKYPSSLSAWQTGLWTSDFQLRCISPRLGKPQLCALLQGHSAAVPSFFRGPCRRPFLEISDSGLGNQLTAFLSEVPSETFS